MVRKTSTAADPRLNLGAMRYGECPSTGSSGRCAGPHALTFADGETYAYDANGNLESKGNTVYAWDHRDRLTSVDDGELFSSHVYDAEGQRVRKTVSQGGVTTATLYLGQYAEVRGGQLVQYVFADEGRTVEVAVPFDSARLIRDFGGEATFDSSIPNERAWYLMDHLGGTSLLLNEAGQTVSEIAYYPYGLTRYEVSIGKVLYRFTSKELDETALYYYETRYYNAKTGHFVSVDPMTYDIKIQELLKKRRASEPQIKSVYSYCQNNPINLVDPDGLWEDKIHSRYSDEDHGWTSPYNPFSTWRHFRSRQATERALRKDVESGNWKSFKSHMHQMQDSFSHYDKGYRWWKLGHLFAGHSPDDPNNDPAKYQGMLARTQYWEQQWTEKMSERIENTGTSQNQSIEFKEPIIDASGNGTTARYKQQEP